MPNDVVTASLEVAAALTVAGRKRDTKRWGWANILGWYKEWAFWDSPRRVRRETP